MSRRKMGLVIVLILVGAGLVGWKLMYRGAYETARYTVLESDGKIELREYPELKLVVTPMQFDAQGNEGSFSRLFAYISGDNQDQQKVAMTTPVFMEREAEQKPGTMSFVLPEKVVQQQVPKPSHDSVRVSSRPAGQYAVIRFSGRIRGSVVDRQRATLEEWIERNGLVAAGRYEVAGYDAPWTPGPFRRNEILIRVENR